MTRSIVFELATGQATPPGAVCTMAARSASMLRDLCLAHAIVHWEAEFRTDFDLNLRGWTEFGMAQIAMASHCASELSSLPTS